jgi:DNA-directed RNA polymerase III subunit RPC3
MHQLSHETALSPRQLRHGLVVLVQHNLLFHYVDPASRAAAYEAKAFSAYALLRIGKFLDVVEESLGQNGPEGREVIESILLLGQARIRDLREVYRGRIRQQNDPGSDGNVQQLPTPYMASATSTPKRTLVRSLEHLTSILAALAEADFLEVVNCQSFQSGQDIYRDTEKRLIATKFPGGARGSKQKEELRSKLYDSFEDTRRRNRDLKRELVDAGIKSNKKQKIFENGDISNGLNHGAFDSASEVSTW